MGGQSNEQETRGKSSEGYLPAPTGVAGHSISMSSLTKPGLRSHSSSTPGAPHRRRHRTNGAIRMRRADTGACFFHRPQSDREKRHARTRSNPPRTVLRGKADPQRRRRALSVYASGLIMRFAQRPARTILGSQSENDRPSVDPITLQCSGTVRSPFAPRKKKASQKQKQELRALVEPELLAPRQTWWYRGRTDTAFFFSSGTDYFLKASFRWKVQKAKC